MGSHYDHQEMWFCTTKSNFALDGSDSAPGLTFAAGSEDEVSLVDHWLSYDDLQKFRAADPDTLFLFYQRTQGAQPVMIELPAGTSLSFPPQDPNG